MTDPPSSRLTPLVVVGLSGLRAARLIGLRMINQE
jgi:hypothetical protein